MCEITQLDILESVLANWDAFTDEEKEVWRQRIVDEISRPTLYEILSKSSKVVGGRIVCPVRYA